MLDRVNMASESPCAMPLIKFELKAAEALKRGGLGGEHLLSGSGAQPIALRCATAQRIARGSLTIAAQLV